VTAALNRLGAAKLSRSARIAWAIAALLWLAATLVFVKWRSTFVGGAHYAAAIPMFVCIGLVVLSNGLAIGTGPERRKLRITYALIAALIALSAFGFLIAKLVGSNPQLIWLESPLLALFAVFWLIQTFEPRDPALARDPGKAPALVARLKRHRGAAPPE
jgi:hypothetical protein